MTKTAWCPPPCVCLHAVFFSEKLEVTEACLPADLARLSTTSRKVSELLSWITIFPSSAASAYCNLGARAGESCANTM